MNLQIPGPLGLVGRLFAILLMAVVIEFAVGTFVYERASHLSLQDDEAKRLAEHLVIARRLVSERPRPERWIEICAAGQNPPSALAKQGQRLLQGGGFRVTRHALPSQRPLTLVGACRFIVGNSFVYK